MSLKPVLQSDNHISRKQNMSLIPEFQKQRQTDLCKFEISLVGMHSKCQANIGFIVRPKTKTNYSNTKIKLNNQSKSRSSE